MYSCCFVECCFQDFKTIGSILVKFYSNETIGEKARVHVVHLYSCTDTATARKKSCFILWEIRFPYYQQPSDSSSCLPYVYVDIDFSRWVRATEVTNYFSSLNTDYNWVSWERYEPAYLPNYGLNNTTTVLLQRWLWH